MAPAAAVRRRHRYYQGPSSAFTPASLSPSVWLKGDGTFWQDSARTTPATADSDPVGAWDDASGNGNHAVQATAGKRPLLRTGVNGLNSVPLVRLDGTDDTLVAPIDARAAQTIVIVGKQRSAIGATGQALLSLGPAASQAAQFFSRNDTGGGYGYYSDQATGIAAVGGTPTNWNIVALTFASAASAKFRVGGGAGVAVDPADTYASATRLVVGSYDSTNNYAADDVVEVVRVASALPLTNLNSLGVYLAAKYGLTWTTAT